MSEAMPFNPYESDPKTEEYDRFEHTREDKEMSRAAAKDALLRPNSGDDNTDLEITEEDDPSRSE